MTLPLRILAAACALAAAAVVPGAASDPREVAPLWTASGTGFVRTLEVGDLDADGRGDVVVGGRGVLALRPASLLDGRPRWVNKWPDGAALTAGDNSFAKTLLLADVTRDGVADALVGGDEGLYALDGRTGAPVWRNTTTTPNGGHNVTAATGGDLNGDGVTDVALAHFLHDKIIAVDGRNGSVLWTSPRLGRTGALITSDVNSDGALDVVQVGASILAGPDVHVLSGLAAATTGTAAPLWAQEFPGGDPTSVALGQVVPGGARELVVGGFAGDIAVYDSVTGQALAAWKRRGRVADLALLDVDRNGTEEIVVANGYEDDGGHSASVDVFAGDGTLRWSTPMPAPPSDLERVDLDGDGRDEFVVGGGWRTFGGRSADDGYLVALRPGPTEAAVAWQRLLPVRVAVVRAGEVFGAEVVLAGHDPDGGVRAFGHDGVQQWSYRTGGALQAVAAADLDGDGRDEVITGADDSAVVVYEADGAVRRRYAVPGAGGPDVVTVAAGRLLDAEPDIVVGTFEYGQGPGGRVHAYGRDGLRWSYSTPGPFGTVLVDDIDADGSGDVIAGAGGVGLSGDLARVARLAADGTVVWEQEVPRSLGLFATLEDVNGDAVDDVVVATSPLGQSHVLALDGTTGQELWRHSPKGIVGWLAVSAAGRVAYGDSQGHVVALAPADGSRTWTAKLNSSSKAGTWVPDATGDGHDDVVSGTAKGKVVLVDGASGTPGWSSAMNPGDRVSSVAALSGPGRGRVAAGTTSNTNGRRGGVYLFDARSGGRLAKEPTEHHVEALASGELDRVPGDELLAGAGWQLHALRPVYGPATGSPPRTASVPGTVAGSNPGGGEGLGVTESHFARDCAIPPTQGVDGYVVDLPAPVRGRRGTAEVSGAALNGFSSVAVAFYSAGCQRLSSAVAPLLAVPPNTRYVVVTMLSGHVTTFELTVVADE